MPRYRRGGFTLPELLIALTMFAVIATAVTRVMRSQQRFLSGAAELSDMRSQLRQAIHVLPAELRPLMPAGGDVYEWSSSTVKFRSITGASVICRLATGELLLPPRVPANGDGRGLTTWLAAPQPGDSVLIHDPGELGDADDIWRAYEVAFIGAASAGNRCDPAGGLEPLHGNSEPAVRLRLVESVALSPTISVGAPIRFFHPVRYALYRSADGKSYLGASDCSAARIPACSVIQPVSGPYGVPEAGMGSGLSLSYEDRSGRVLHPGSDDARDIALIRILVRSASSGRWWGSGRGRRLYDSLSFVVSMRGLPSPHRGDQ